MLHTIHGLAGLVVHPDTFNSVRGFFSRYALKKVVRGEWHYGRLTLTKLLSIIKETKK